MPGLKATLLDHAGSMGASEAFIQEFSPLTTQFPKEKRTTGKNAFPKRLFAQDSTN